MNPSTSSSSSITDKETYKSTGLMNLAHGIIYQVHILMFMMIRALNLGYTFKIATEYESGEKFDDVVIEYEKPNLKIRNYLFLQAKHSKSGEDFIYLNDFLPNFDQNQRKRKVNDTFDKPFDLRKYFQSYINILKNPKYLSSNAMNRFFILFSNSKIAHDVKGRSKKLFFERNDFKTETCSDLFVQDFQKLNDNFNQRDEILNKIYENLDSKENAEKFINELYFAFDQPSEKEFRNLIKNEFKNLKIDKINNSFIGKIIIDNIFLRFYDWTIKWFNERSVTTKHNSDLNTFLESAKINLFDAIYFDILPPNNLFTGRNDKMLDLFKNILKKTTDIINVAIVGMGGVGKTEFILKFINDYKNESLFDHVIWINADNENTLYDSFLRLGKYIGLINDNDQLNINELTQKIYKYFEIHTTNKCIFVFDNAQQYKTTTNNIQGINEFLPKISINNQKFYIIITSQIQDWDCNLKIKMEVFEPIEALEFLLKSLGNNYGNNEELEKLSLKLEHLPLALQLAVDYIKVRDSEEKVFGGNYTVNKYLENYDECTTEFLEYSFSLQNTNTYNKTLLTTWSMAIQLISLKEHGQKALDTLYCMAYLEPQDIPVKMFLNDDRRILGKILKILEDHSLINIESGYAKIHRLIQAITRENLKFKENTNKRQALDTNAINENKILERLIQIFINDINKNKLDNKYNLISDEYLIHASKMWSFCINHDDLLTKHTSLAQNIIEDLAKHYMLDTALTFAETTRLQIEKIETMNEENLILFNKSIARLSIRCGKYNHALTLISEVLSKLEKSKNENWDDFCEALSLKASILRRTRQLDEALIIYDEIIEIRKSKPDGLKKQKTMDAMHNRAMTLERQNKYEDALISYQEVQILEEKYLEKNHNTFLNTTERIALVLHKIGKIEDREKVIEIYNRVLEGKIEKLKDENHPKILLVLNNKASILSEQGNLELAYKILIDVSQKSISKLGFDHPNTLTTLYTKGVTEHMLEKYDIALATLSSIVDKMIQIKGEQHEKTKKTIELIDQIKQLLHSK